MNDRTLTLLLVVAAAAFLYAGARRTVSALSRRRRERRLAAGGIRAHGSVSAVHPMDRSSGRHEVTVRVYDERGGVREAVDDSGTGGFLLREGTPVTLVYSPEDPGHARVERAAFPDPSMGDHPLHPGDGSGTPSPVAALFPLGASLAIVGIMAAVALNGAEWALILVPALFALVGSGLLVRSAYALVTGQGVRRGYGASTIGVVTDSWTETRVRRKDGRTRKVRLHPFTVRFRADDGREVHVRHAVAGSTFIATPGQRLRVDYDPLHPPRYSLPDGPGMDRLPHLVPLIIGVVFTVVGSVLTWVFWNAGPF
ncbi:DUF3592 domain-containing protein [Nocardiopsis lambiniae]|uniref:DUF3592 domain-containing protein n=1 Tax=Nocardiopsis lambiniae TaxID=3075539 RepID=A0ABU2M7M3_9ACTN|nr:DUF3592 domain-containing protein [Nocardiopsis sp. DSM 44743]MDT0328651.1 DUF3592 domain-containing protein [Nocardiopsis sp. DSM 44743]